MNYYTPEEDPFDTGEIDPYAMDQAMVDFMIANGVGTGLLPQVQPSGKPMTTSNITSALSANRQGLFDTAFQGGMGGADAFAPGAFQPTVSTSIKQTPELQQMYGYLRAPDSYEGLIANEILNGGNAGTALRKIRELLAAETTDPALKESLLLELPQREVDYGMPAPDLTPENVNWDAGETSVAGRAREINELYAQIPRVGPSAPQWGTDPQTGQPIQISAGGELQWGEDESGNPVLLETTVTPSEAAQTFTDLGLPTPDQEYMAEDFMSPDQIAMQQAYAETEDPVAELKAAWMDPSLAPSNRDAPRDWDTAEPAAAGWGGSGGGGGGNRPMTPEEQAAYALAKLTYDSNPIANAAGQVAGAVGGIPAAAALGPLSGVAQQIAGGGAPNPLVAGPLSAVAGGGWRGADELLQGAMSGLGSLFGSSDPQAAAAQPQADPDQAAMLAQLIAQAAQGDQSVDLDPGGLLAGGGWAGEGVNVDELMRRRAAMNAPGVPPPQPPQPGGTGALDEYLGNYTPTPPTDPMLAPGGTLGAPNPWDTQTTQQQAPPPGIGAASGGPFAINLAPAPYVEGGPIPPVTINGQPNPAYQDYLDTLLRGQFGQDQIGAPPQSETAPWTTPQAPPPGIGAASGSPFAINTARSPLAGPPQGGLPQSEQAITAPYRGGTAAPQSEQAITARRPTPTSAPQSEQTITATPQITGAMIAAILGGNAPAALQGGLPQSEQAGRGTQVRGQTPSSAPQSEQAIQRQAMQRYQFPQMATGELSARGLQAEEDERNASVLGGSTDRTGRRVRPTRTGEQARQYRAAFEAWDQATDEQFRMKQAAHNTASGRALGEAWIRQQQGVRPLDQAMMARRLVMMNAGVPQGI